MNFRWDYGDNGDAQSYFMVYLIFASAGEWKQFYGTAAKKPKELDVKP